MVMKPQTTLEDLVGIEYAKLGFFGEVQKKIAELQASNQELERKSQQIQAILDGITDVMVVISLDLCIVSVNHAFYETFRDPFPEGRPCYEVFRRSKHPCSPCPVVVARNRNQVCRQLVIYPVDGKNRHFEITASPLRNSQGEPCHILVLKRDVTLEKEYQAKYYQAEKMATVGMLAAGVAHEINNPLAAISGFAEGLKRRLPRIENRLEADLVEDFEEYVGTILKECRRCQEIVQSLLTFSRQKAMDFSPFDLNTLVTDTLKLIHHRIKQFTDQPVHLELDAALPSIYGDPSQLKQVILNLVLNALDAIEQKGTITIRTFMEDGEWVHLMIEDTGCGIPGEHMDKLFEPFFTTKPVGHGVGIGLATCYHIIQNHGGEIVVGSEKGKGSVFTVKLPQEMQS